MQCSELSGNWGTLLTIISGGDIYVCDFYNKNENILSKAERLSLRRYFYAIMGSYGMQLSQHPNCWHMKA